MAESTIRLNPTVVFASVGVSSPSNTFLSDNVSTNFSAANDQVEDEGYTDPETHPQISKVLIGVEAHLTGSGLNPSFTLSYKVNGVSGSSTYTFNITGSTDSTFFYDVTADRAWTATDISNLRVSLKRNSIGAGYQTAAVDHIYVEITEQDFGTPPGFNTIVPIPVGVTPVQVIMAPTPPLVFTYHVQIQSLVLNTGIIYVGSNNGVAVGTGYSLEPGQFYHQEISTDLNLTGGGFWCVSDFPGQTAAVSIYTGSLL